MKNRYWRKQDGQQWRRPMAIIHTSDLGDLGKNCKGIQQWFSSVHSISERLNWIDWAEKFCWNSNYLKHLLTDIRPWSQQQGNYFIKIGPPRLQWIWNQNCKKKLCYHGYTCCNREIFWLPVCIQCFDHKHLT